MAGGLVRVRTSRQSIGSIKTDRSWRYWLKVIYPCLPSDRIWHTVFFYSEDLGVGRVPVKTRILQYNARHRIGAYKMKLCKPLPNLPAHKPDDLAGHSLNQIRRSRAMLVNDSSSTRPFSFDTPSDTNARWSTRRLGSMEIFITASYQTGFNTGYFL